MKFEPNSEGDPKFACENCQTQPLEKFVVPQCTVMWHCPSCDLFQKGTYPDVSAYDLRYHDIYEPFRRRKLRTAYVRLNRIATYLDQQTPRLLDIGCSLGATVEGAGRRGWEAWGVDLSADAVDYCRERGLNCVKSDGLRLTFC